MHVVFHVFSPNLVQTESPRCIFQASDGQISTHGTEQNGIFFLGQKCAGQIPDNLRTSNKNKISVRPVVMEPNSYIQG
jgi:hypothetical protein